MQNGYGGMAAEKDRAGGGICSMQKKTAMAGQLFCMADTGKGPRGRPKAAEGEPSMPKTWKDTAVSDTAIHAAV